MSYKSLILLCIATLWASIGITYASTSCFFNGLSMTSGQVATGYKYSTVLYASWSLCTTVLTWYETFQCLSNGTLDWINGNNLWSQHYSAYPYLSCTVQAPADCVVGTPFGQQKTIKSTPDGFFNPLLSRSLRRVGYIGRYMWYNPMTGYTMDSYLAPVYELNTVDDSANCNIPPVIFSGTYNILSYTGGTYTVITGENTTMAYCYNGELYDLMTSTENLSATLLDTDQYKYSTCSKRPARDCRLGNITILDDASIVTYNTSDAQWGSTCTSQTRTCDDGTLSGSYIYTSCMTYTWSCGIASGHYFPEVPTYNLCAWGTPSTLTWSSTTRSWSRTCAGNGWDSTSATCQAYRTGENTVWICNTFPYGASILSSDSPWLCRVGVAQLFATSNYGWNWRCHTEVGNSYCEARQWEIPTATITYSTTSLTNGPVTAYLSNIVPYGTVVYNNNGNNSRSFTNNGSFVFALKFGDTISYLTASVSWINQWPRTLADLVRSYTNTIVPAYRSLIRPQSSRYNLIDIQTMTNLGILKPTGTRSSTLDMKKKVTRAEFVDSIYTLMQTIHSYNDLPTSRSDGYTYKWGSFSTTQRYQLGRATALDLRDHIKSKKTKKAITIDRKKNITPKEVNDTITALLLMHDDNTALWSRVRSETIDAKQKTLTKAQYASMLRRMLESYDGIPIGNNLVIINKIYERVQNKTIPDQQKEIANAMLTLRQSDPVAMEKLGLSLGHLLIDLDAVVNNTIPKKKWRTILSINQIKQKNRANDNASTIFNGSTDWRQDFLTSQY